LTISGAITFSLTLAPLLVLFWTAPGQLAPMQIDPRQIGSWVANRQYALQAAAVADGRAILSNFVVAQTWLAFAALAVLGLYFFWRGFVSQRVRGWTHFFWIVGICLAFFAPTLAPGFTPQLIDYTTAFSVGLREAEAFAPRMKTAVPEAIMAARAILAVSAALLVALCMHDLGYRLQEAFIEFGFIGNETKGQRGETYRRRPASSSRPAGGDGERAAESGQGFGHRDPSVSRLDQPTARACAILGVRVGASRAEIERAYRTKMKTAHPDHGGSVERATALNEARDLLLPRA
jgi:hypothetical protein